MAEDLITIVIPVYNREHIVKKSLDSIARQTIRPLNVVLVDNHSTDGTRKTLERWKAENESGDFHIKVISEDRQGPSHARNAGLMAVETPWTLFFDSDDIMPDNHMEKVTGTIEKNPDAQIVLWGMLIHYLNGKTRKNVGSIKYPEYENIMRSLFSTLKYAAKTDLLRRAGGWDTALSVAEDIELGSRMLALKPNMTFIKDHFVSIYQQKDSLTNTLTGKIGSFVPAYTKIGSSLPENKRHWTELQLIIQAASWAKKDPDSPNVVKDILSRQPYIRRQIFNVLYRYTLLGLPGASRIYAALHFFRMRV